jgi:hypothetical protein
MKVGTEFLVASTRVDEVGAGVMITEGAVSTDEDGIGAAGTLLIIGAAGATGTMSAGAGAGVAIIVGVALVIGDIV